MAISGSRVRVTNISDEHIGLSRPSSAFLRRKGYKPANLTWATFPAEWVDDAMRALEVQGRILIHNLDEKGRVVREEKPQADPEGDQDKAPEDTVVALKESEDDEPGDDNPDGSEVIVEDEAPKVSDSAVVNLTPEPKDATVPTVSSGLDGDPVSENIPDGSDGDLPPADTEKSSPEDGDDEAVKYTKSALRKMNLRGLREVLEDREINIDSTRKDPIIEAILDHQNLGA
ncbi:hypothetical protein LCGC14_0516460 [marine sediment metagenome]|uniref:Uncharacterized protein n=1 Tax=marine sediment metagenome TaxID=412755 RepID=A0A0F9V7Y4_9ZZZZ